VEIILEGISKRFKRNRVLKEIDLGIESGDHVAILGSNGSGKSTLLRILSGFSTPSNGTIKHKVAGEFIPLESVPRRMFHVAPYIDLYTAFNLKESLDFHFSLREYRDGWNKERVMEALKLPAKRALDTFSSGMLQRVRIALAWATESDCLLFDEVGMNLDSQGIDWFNQGLNDHLGNRTVIIASNQEEQETTSCLRRFRIQEGRIVDESA